jgi:beta-barrel assembly-enhancing protease
MRSRGGAGGIRLLIALAVAAFALIRYFGSSSTNPVTGEKQYVSGITPKQEVALGLQAAPQLFQQFGGESRDIAATNRVKSIGERVVAQSSASKSSYPFEFHLLDDDRTINAFALPGGQIFITEALLKRLKSDGEVAGVLAHEIVHVIGRHGSEHIAKQQLTQGLTGAAVLAAYDPNNPSSRNSAAIVAAIGQLVNMKYGRDDEIESDVRGVQFMSEAGYDPRGMIGVQQTLKAAASGGRPPEFFSTHPNPENRIQRIEEAIKKLYPSGIPGNLVK